MSIDKPSERSSFSRPIPADLARLWIQEYQAIFHDNQDTAAMAEAAKTEYVNFKRIDLRPWLDHLQDTDYTDIRVYLGVYTDDVYTYPNGDILQAPADKVGRLMTILWPYSDGEPAKYLRVSLYKAWPAYAVSEDGGDVDPFNLGDLVP